MSAFRVRAGAIVAIVLSLPSATIPMLRAQVVVTPQGSTTANKLAHTTGYTQNFRVQNEASFQQTFNLDCDGASSVTSVSCPGSITVNGDAFKSVTVTYSTGNEGSGQIYFTASNGGSSDQGWVNVPVVLPAGAPRMSVLPYLEAKQDYGRCAASCFAAMYAQSTVPYFSLDQPRNITLVYNGDRVAPKPFVAVDVFPDTTYGSWPSEYQFQVKIDGVLRTFVNEETTLRFAGTSGSTPYRIGGQLKALPFTNGSVKPMEILVTAIIGGSSFTNRWITQYLHIDDASSAIARGWTLAGVQRAYITINQGILITEGGGNATYFKYNPVTLKYEAPAGDFSVLKTGSGSTWIRSYPDSTKVTFNSSGLMIKVADRWSVRDTLIYVNDKLSQLKDPLNNIITLAYDANGVDYITDPFGRTTQVTVDASKRLTAIQDPDAVSTTFGYDANLRLQTITNRAGQTTTLGYDPQSGKLATVTAPQIRVYGGGLTSPVTTFAAWQKVGIPYSGTSTPFGPARADTVYGRVTEPGGTQTTQFTVNRWGSPAAVTNALGEVTTTTYTVHGQPARVVAPGYGGQFDTLGYNGSGLLTYQRTVKDSGTTIVYGGWAQPTQVYGPQQDSTRIFIGTNGRVDSVKVGGQLVQKILSYDNYGRPVTVKDGLGTTVAAYVYFTTGAHRNLNSVTAPGNRVTSHAYDAYGRSTITTPPSGALPRHLRYDVLNRVLADSIPTAGSPTVTRYAYDPMHRVTQVTDPKSQVYQFVYNAVGWSVKSIDPAGAKDTTHYDPNGDLRRYTNRRNQNINFTYDAVHRQLTRVGSASVSWSYANNGYTITATSPASTETTYLGIRGVTDSIKTVLAGQTYWRRYEYTDGKPLLDSVTVSGPGGMSFRGRKYLYNVPKGLLTTIRLGGRTTTFTFNGNFNLTGITLPDGGTKTFTVGTLHTPIKATTSASYNFAIESWLGINLLGQVAKDHGYPNASHGSWFDYDLLGRLTITEQVQRNPEAQWNGCSDPDFGLMTCTPPADYLVTDADTVIYDAVGNRTDKGGTYTAGNRITTFNNCTYGTDADGNVISRAGSSCTSPATFFWNAEGQLDSMLAGSNRVHVLYDADGRVVQKKLNGTSQSYFLYDGSNLLAELNGTATVKLAEYSYYPGLDNLHALVVGDAAYYAHEDFMGNVGALTDSTQAIKRTYGYDEWGNLVSGSDNLPFNGVDRARWKGALWMGPEVDAYYMRNRWYESGTGRFLSEDPIGVAGGINPMIFAGSDPINGSDPVGLYPDKAYRLREWAFFYWPWSFTEGPPPLAPPGLGELMKYSIGAGPGGGGGGVRPSDGNRPGWQKDPVKCGAAVGLAMASVIPGARAGGKIISRAIKGWGKEFPGMLGKLVRFQPRGLMAGGAGAGAWVQELGAPWGQAADLDFHKMLAQQSIAAGAGLLDDPLGLVLDFLPVVGTLKGAYDAWNACR